MIVSSGAKQSIMNVLYAILEPKDEVIFPAPYWVSYPEMVKLAGGVPVAVPPEDGSFQPTVPDIADAVGSYTKADHPQQPEQPLRGHVLGATSSPRWSSFCEKKNLWLIMDDIYNRLVFDGQKAPNPYDFAKDDRSSSSKLVVIQGVSKMYAMTGFRIGWAARQPRAGRGDDQHPVAPDLGPGDAVAVGGRRGALTACRPRIESLRLTLENKRNVMVERPAARSPAST